MTTYANWLLGCVILLALWKLLGIPALPDPVPVSAQGMGGNGAPTSLMPAPLSARPQAQIDPAQRPDDTACRLCHSDTEAAVQFPSGETLPVLVDLQALHTSAHGIHAETPLACTSCHDPNRYQFPHPPVAEPDLRSYELSRALLCQECHVDPHLDSHPDRDDATPVVCTDCHGAHDVLTAEQWFQGQGTERCVDCHTELDVPTSEAETLAAMIRHDLFTQQPDNEYCLACHTELERDLVLTNGDTRDLFISGEELHDSVHGAANPWQPLQCTYCHGNYLFPHPPVTADSAREYVLEHYTACETCHEPKYEETLDSVHGQALREGNIDAAVCSDCHPPHTMPPPDEPRARISYTCEQCHDAVFDEYADSVHGEALLEESNPDVPTCTDCHGVHDIPDPTTALFRVRSPQLCGQCHADEELMAQYDIRTEVFDTYVADFHGTTVVLFEHEAPEVETNKAVCYDCHGVHDIRAPEDPHAGIKENLLAVCQRCHPDATANFPDSWTSHWVPSLERNPMVYLVNVFYELVIPATVGFVGFLVFTDVYRRFRVARKEADHES